eukprot:c14607_g1_i1 orf=176-460(-)
MIFVMTDLKIGNDCNCVKNFAFIWESKWSILDFIFTDSEDLLELGVVEQSLLQYFFCTCLLVRPEKTILSFYSRRIIFCYSYTQTHAHMHGIQL